jgi:hypothetical protein
VWRVSPHTPRCGCAPDVGDELRVCVNILGLNRAAAQELFWLSRVGRSGGSPCSYIRMPFGLLNVAASYQHRMQGALGAHEAGRQAILTEEAPDPHELPGPPEPQEPTGS